MAYASWSVVYGETPSASKWNILGTNDASFNDGTGIAGLYKNLLTVDSNPYKFSAYRNAAFTISNGSYGKVTFDTEEYDTNNNFASGTYTAPVTGFYQFNWRVSHNNSGSNRVLSVLYKNGVLQKRGTDVTAPFGGSNGAYLLPCTAGDTVEVWSLTTTAALGGDAGVIDTTWFNGYLVSRT